MKKRVFLSAALCCLLLTGCGDLADRSSPSLPSSQNADLQSSGMLYGSSISKTEAEAQSSEIPNGGSSFIDFGDYGITQSREEYFSKEQYVKWDSHTGGPSDHSRISRSAGGSSFYFETKKLVVVDGKLTYPKELLFSAAGRVEHEFVGSEYLVYYIMDQALYRAFIPDYPHIEPEKIFASEEPFHYHPVTNFVTVICYPSEAWKVYMEGDTEKDFIGVQYDYAFFDVRDGSLTSFRLSDVGYEDSQHIVTIPLEDLYSIE